MSQLGNYTENGAIYLLVARGKNYEKASFATWKYRSLGGSRRCQHRPQPTSLGRRRPSADLSSGRMRFQLGIGPRPDRRPNFTLEDGPGKRLSSSQPIDDAWPDLSSGSDVGVCPASPAVVCLFVVSA